jgi:hypothetical protein
VSNKFIELYAALLEVKEKRAKFFKQNRNLKLLKSRPMPQNRSQLYIAHSLIKHVHEDYTVGEEITITPLINKTKLYAGWTKVEIKKHASLAPNSNTEVSTNLTTDPNISIDGDRFLSLYTTRPPFNNKPKTGVAREVTVTSKGDVSIIPASQAPMTQDVLAIAKQVFGEQMVSRLGTASPNSGGHPILDMFRTLNQCQLDGRSWSHILPLMKQGENFINIDIGSKYVSQQNSNRTIL